MSVDLDGRVFIPVENSAGGAVGSGTRFVFAQQGALITADYAGAGIEDGHIVGRVTGERAAHLLYHCRRADGALAAGEAQARFGLDDEGRQTIAMNWRWLNGGGESGQSVYVEVAP